MDQYIQIICKNTGIVKDYLIGTTLFEIAADQNIKLEDDILGAVVNNKLRELNYGLYKPKTIKFIDIHNPHGYRMFMRSLIFVLYKAVHDLYPNLTLNVEHSLPIGYYCELDGHKGSIPLEMIFALKQRMEEIIRLNLPFTRSQIPSNQAVGIFKANNQPAKAMLFETRQRAYSSVYYLDNLPNYFYGYLVPSTSYLKTFHIDRYFSQGIIIIWPSYIELLNKNRKVVIKEYLKERSKGGTKLFKIFQEQKEWLRILGVPYVGYLNKEVQNKGGGRLIKISEALQEKKFACIADEIAQKEDCRLVLISGPSSSGKTTFCKRLSIQLQVLGFDTAEISLDDYFLNRDKTPLDETGEYDFESINAVDIPFFTEQLNTMLDSPSSIVMDLPVFDFVSGSRKMGKKKITVNPNTIVLVEGIHGLNPILSAGIKEKYIFKIFVSALSHVAIDAQNPIRSTDNRLIRRIVRDHNFRGYSALETLQRWDSVVRGENKNIFPFQENADVMFNSALLFELGVLKKYAEPLLRDVPESVPEFAVADHLLKFLSYFMHIDEKEIPPTSILREFLGESSFLY